MSRKRTCNRAATIENLREPEIKAALIDALFEDGRIYGDSVVISEMPLTTMSRRADIVLANGHLLGFEIKSDGDKITRLCAQIEAYQRTFEGIFIVSGARHLSQVINSAPHHVGIVAIDLGEGSIPEAKMIRKPHFKNMSIEVAIRQMRANELFKLAQKFNANPGGARDRFTLERQVRELPATEVRLAALEAVKNRYRSPYEAFLLARSQSGRTLEALRYLQRPSWNASRAIIPNEQANSCASEIADLQKLKLNVRPRKVG
ncbi:sce7726 family protein [Fodinicurvata halophila]|uniref:Sce7726 family protein n=1 Tax=Fodinicurvata halophila TaxID=1419723 RepID=A0ABV8UQH5_9PROT